MENDLIDFIKDNNIFTPLLSSGNIEIHKVEIFNIMNGIIHCSVYYTDLDEDNTQDRKIENSGFFEVNYTWSKYIRIEEKNFNNYIRKNKLKKIIKKIC